MPNNDSKKVGSGKEEERRTRELISKYKNSRRDAERIISMVVLCSCKSPNQQIQSFGGAEKLFRVEKDY